MVMFAELKIKQNRVLARWMSSKIQGNPKNEKDEREKIKAKSQSFKSINNKSNAQAKLARELYQRYD